MPNEAAYFKSALLAATCYNISEECPPSTFMNDSLSSCEICPMGCAICNENGTCIENCSSSCEVDCIGTASNCISCNQEFLQINGLGSCNPNCTVTAGMFVNASVVGMCDFCPLNCETCFSENSCEVCRQGFFLNTDAYGNSYCAEGCGQVSGQYGNLQNGQCQNCSAGCLQCSSA